MTAVLSVKVNNMVKIIIKWSFAVIFILLACASIWLYQFAANWDDIAEPIYSKTSTSVRVPFGKIVLVRGKAGLGAFKILHRVSRYGFLNGVKYEYWISDQGEFSPAKSTSGTDAVYERYKVVKVISDKERKVEDAGGQLNIAVGNYLIEWSGGNHIYNQTYISKNPSVLRLEPFEIAATNWTDIKDINFSDTTLKWLKSNY